MSWAFRVENSLGCRRRNADMTLGRTSSGSIKIKTDGGTPRAVACTCCGGGVVCGCSSVPSALAAIIEASPQITVNGTAKPWNGAYAEKANSPFGEADWVVSYASGFVCVYADNGENTLKLAPEPLTANACGFPTGFSTIGAPVVINGQAFRAVHAFPDIQVNLNITFS